jgi:Protein of unknown function (DUF3551)
MATLVMPMSSIMRLVLAVAVSAAALCFHVAVSRAFADAPWCAVTDGGTGSMYWDCQYRSIEECRPNVLAGNRGWCNPNPYFVANPIEYRRSTKRRARSQ